MKFCNFISNLNGERPLSCCQHETKLVVGNAVRSQPGKVSLRWRKTPVQRGVKQLHIVSAASAETSAPKSTSKQSSSGVGSGIRLEDVAVTFKNHQVLKNASWDVKKGERV